MIKTHIHRSYSIEYRYSTHPFRYFTLGTSSSQGVDIEPSIYCLENSTRTTCRNADSNTGWTQGVLNAALLGRADRASKMVSERANTSPAIGYVFPGFAPHMQDYQPYVAVVFFSYIARYMNMCTTQVC